MFVAFYKTHHNSISGERQQKASYVAHSVVSYNASCKGRGFFVRLPPNRADASLSASTEKPLVSRIQANYP